MFEIIIIALVFCAGYYVGIMRMSWLLKDIIIKEARKEGLHIDDQYNIIENNDDKPTVFQLFIERANDILYLYEKEHGTFVCQGSNLEELATLAKEYKNIKYAAVLNDDKIYAFIDGEVKLEHEVLAK